MADETQMIRGRFGVMESPNKYNQGDHLLLTGIRPKQRTRRRTRTRRQRPSPSTEALLRNDRTGVLQRALKFSRSTGGLHHPPHRADGPSTANASTAAAPVAVNNFVAGSQAPSSTAAAAAAAADRPAAAAPLAATMPAKLTMSAMPSAPRVSSFYAKLDHTAGSVGVRRKQTKRTKKSPPATITRNESRSSSNSSNRAADTATAATAMDDPATATDPAAAAATASCAASGMPSAATPLTNPLDYININPKDKQSPFAPRRQRRILSNASARTKGAADRELAQMESRMRGMGADAAALDEFNGLLGKQLYLFGGFGIKREKPGAGRRGWRNIWDATSILTSQQTVPREDIERAEGCSYFCGDTYSLMLERRPRWRHVHARHASKESANSMNNKDDEGARSPGHSPVGHHAPVSPVSQGHGDRKVHAPPQVALAPLGRSDHTLTLVHGSFAFIFGGKQRGNMHGGDATPLNDICVLDLHSSSPRKVWRSAAVYGRVPSRRWGHAAAFSAEAGGVLFVVGGIAAASPFGRFDPYLDESHQTSIPRRDKPAEKKKKSPRAEGGGAGGDLPNGLPAKQNTPPGLIGALHCSTMTWSVPPIVTEPMQGAPGVEHISQAEAEQPPYALCGHSMVQNAAWRVGRSCDLFVYGGWEWTRSSKGRVEGPSLSQSLRILRVADSRIPADLTTATTWARIRVPDPDGHGPGPRANHASAGHKLGLFIFGGRCFDAMTHSANMIRHGSNTSVQLKYLNDLRVLVRFTKGSHVPGTSANTGGDDGYEDDDYDDDDYDDTRGGGPRSQLGAVEKVLKSGLDSADTVAKWVENQCEYRWAAVLVTGAPPRPRENAQLININDGSLLLHGGFSGVPGHCPPRDEMVEGLPPGTIDHPWLHDLFVLRVSRDREQQQHSGAVVATWTQVLTGPRGPSPRCGHRMVLADVAETDTSRCHFSGKGMNQCVVGTPAVFHIRAFDERGQPRWAGRDKFRVLVEGPWPGGSGAPIESAPSFEEGPEAEDGELLPPTVDTIVAHVEDRHDGTYEVRYTAMLAGNYSIGVMCNGDHVDQSPFSMWAQAGPATPGNSRVTEIDGEARSLEADPPQFILTAGDTASIGVTTRDGYGNLRVRGGEAWRLKTHILSLSEDIDGDSANMLRWRHASPHTTDSLSTVSRSLFVDAIKVAAADISGLVQIKNGAMSINSPSNVDAVDWQTFSGKEARSTLKDFVSRTVRLGEAVEPLARGGGGDSLAEVLQAEEIVERVSRRGKFMGGAYYVLSTTVKLTSIGKLRDAPDDSGANVAGSDGFFQKWSVLFHAVDPEGGAEHGLLLEDGSALKLVAAMKSTALVNFRSFVFNEIVPTDKNQQQYTCDLTVPAVPGPALIAVTMDGRHICGSPFKTNLRPANPSAACSNVSSAGKAVVSVECTAGESLPLRIDAFDQNNLARDSGGKWFVVSAQRQGADSSSLDDAVSFEVADHGDGHYTTSVGLTTMGVWEVSVSCFLFAPELRGEGGGNATERLPGSPFRVEVHPSGVCASQCVVDGIFSNRAEWSRRGRLQDTVDRTSHTLFVDTRVAPHRIVAGSELSFRLTARDAYGNRLPDGHTSNFTMRLVRQGQHELFGVVETTENPANGSADGPTHICRATVQQAALYELHVTQGMDPVPSMPVALLVEPDVPDPSCCELTSVRGESVPVVCSLAVGEIAEVFLVAKDRFGNTCSLTIDDVAANLVWPVESVSAETSKDGRDTCEILPLGDGSYRCRYGSTRAGKFSLHFSHAGVDVRGSPVFINVAAGEADVKSFDCAGAAFLSTLTARTRAHFTVFARDEHRNRITHGGQTFSVSGKVVRWGVDPWKDREEQKARSYQNWEHSRDSQRQRRQRRKERRALRQQQLADIESKAADYRTTLLQRQRARQGRKLRRYCSTRLVDSMCAAIAAADGQAAEAERRRQAAARELSAWERERARPRAEDEPPFSAPRPSVPAAQDIGDFVQACYRSQGVPSPANYLHMLDDLRDLREDAQNSSGAAAGNYGIDLEGEVSDDSDEEVGDYEEPAELSEPITDQVAGMVTDNNDGTHDVEVVLDRYVIGDVSLDVVDAASGTHVAGSPFVLRAGRPDAGTGPEDFEVLPNPGFDRYAGVPLSVRVRDKSKQSLSGGGEAGMACFIVPLPSRPADAADENATAADGTRFENHAPPADGAAVLGEAFQLPAQTPGTSTVDFNHCILGARRYRVVVTKHGQQVDGSPFTINIRGAKSHAGRCVTFGTGCSDANVGDQAEFYICVCDQFGNLRTSGEDQDLMCVVAESQQAGAAGVHDLSVAGCAPGIYKCQYTPDVAGTISLIVTCNDAPVPGSPFSVRVSPGPISGAKTTAAINVSEDMNSPVSALQLFEESKDTDASGGTNTLRVPAGAPLRLVLHTRDANGNTRSAPHSSQDARLLMVHWKRADGSDVYSSSLKPRLIPIANSSSLLADGGTLQCIFQLLKEGMYTIFVTATEYTSTRVGRYGTIKNVTDAPIHIRVLPARCHAPSCKVFPQKEDGVASGAAKGSQFTWDAETSTVYSRYTRKKIMEIATTSSSESMRQWCYGPYSRSRRQLDVAYHGIFTRARQELQDEIVGGILNSGPSTPAPYFVLLTGVAGAGKRHAMRWLDRAGRFPMSAFLWIDPSQIALQLPEYQDLLVDTSNPTVNHKARAATRREAGCLAEILVGEALFRKKSIVLSTATRDCTWWQTWLEATHSLHPDYRFACIDIDAPAADVVRRHETLQKAAPFQPVPAVAEVESATKAHQECLAELTKLELWEYTATIQNSDVGDDGKGPTLVSESGGHAWSTAPEPSVAEGVIEYTDLELEAIAWRDQLSQVWVDHALVMPRSRVSRKLQSPGFAKLLHRWRLFCGQWVSLTDAMAPGVANALASAAVPVERSTWNSRPRLLLRAGETASVKVLTFDIYRNPIMNADATEIRVELTEENAASTRAPLRAYSSKPNGEAKAGDQLTCTSDYDGDGSYTCAYGSTRAGVYQLKLGNSAGHEVPGSPFWLQVVSGDMHPPSCTASGPGLLEVFAGAEQALFTIETFDEHMNAIRSGGHHFDVHVISSTASSTAGVAAGLLAPPPRPGSKKAALRDALDHASQLEGEVDLLSTAHAAVVQGQATQGEVSDLGNGKYSVTFDPRRVPLPTAGQQKSLVILVVDADSGEHVSGSPFVVPYVPSKILPSQCNLEIDHIRELVAGDVYSAVIRVPHSAAHVAPPSVVVRPLYSGDVSQIPEQALCIFPSSDQELTTLFSVHQASDEPIMFEAAFGGSAIKAAGHTTILPAVTASSAVPAQCTVNSLKHHGGLRRAAAGQYNVFEIQARDRFGVCLREQDCGTCRARVLGPLGRGVQVSQVGGKPGTWTFEYFVPDAFGLFGHSGDAVRELQIAVELWDDQREIWSHIGASPFTVPVHVMLGESLQFFDGHSDAPVQGTRVKMWTGHGGSGTHVIIGCAGDDGVFAIGDLRHFAPGLYTLEVEARGFFPRRLAAFVPEHGSEAPKQAPKMVKAKPANSGGVAAGVVLLSPPEFVPISSSDELPRLRVLQQGDIDLSDEPNAVPELQHVWWFAKKDAIVAASMKTTGDLVELSLDQCVALFGDDPEAEGHTDARIPTSYALYLEARTVYNRQMGDLMKTQEDGAEDRYADGNADDETAAGAGGNKKVPVRWQAVQRLALERNTLGTFLPREALGAPSSSSSSSSSSMHTTRQGLSAELISQMSKRSELLVVLSWTMEPGVAEAPSLFLEFGRGVEGQRPQRLTYAHTTGPEGARSGDLFTSWQRDERKCREVVCLRDMPSSALSIRAAPSYALFEPEADGGDGEAQAASGGEEHIADLSKSCAVVQVFQRSGHVGTFVAEDALRKFRPESRGACPMLRADWCILSSSESADDRSVLQVEHAVQVVYGDPPPPTPEPAQEPEVEPEETLCVPDMLSVASGGEYVDSENEWEDEARDARREEDDPSPRAAASGPTAPELPRRRQEADEDSYDDDNYSSEAYTDDEDGFEDED